MQGSVVAITGANRGIGAAAAREFAAAGARVALLVRDPDRVGDLAAALPGARVFACDVADWAQVLAAVAGVLDWGGRLDVLVNNAGTIDPIAAVGDVDPAAFAAAVAANLTGTLHGMRAAIPVMRAQRRGTILNLSSGAAVNPLEGWGAYCASKAGAAMLTRVAHVEEAGHGLRILGLSPGTVATDMQTRIRQSGVNQVSRLNPAAHIPPEWAARALVWMCSPAADPWLGRDLSLREAGIRRALGLPE